MCCQCDYEMMMRNAGLKALPNRRRVLEIVGGSSSPLTAREIYQTFVRGRAINRVTLYRILDLLVERRLIERISAGDRSFRYGLAGNRFHPPHPHFYCTQCGHMECLHPQSLAVDIEALRKTYPSLINRVEIRLDGICKDCLRRNAQEATRRSS